MAWEMSALGLPLLLSCLWQGLLAGNSGYDLEVQRTVTVQEGLCVFVPCTITYPRSYWMKSDKAYGYWYRGGADTGWDSPVATNNPQKEVEKTAKGRFQLTGDPAAYNCSLRITDVQKKDAGDYFFRVERGYYTRHNYREQMLFLIVTDLTHTPEIYVPEMLKSGHPGKVNCVVPWACEKATPPNFFWTRAGIDSAVLATPRSSVLTFTPQPRDHGTHLTCQVTFPAVHVTMKRTVQLNVSYAPNPVSVNIFWANCTAPMNVSNGTSLPVLAGLSLHLVCVAHSNPPASLSWSWKGEGSSPSRVSASGVLELSHVRCEDAGEYTCHAQHPLGPQHLSLSLSVHRSLSACPRAAEKEHSCSFMITLISGAITGAGLLIVCGLLWFLCNRKSSSDSSSTMHFHDGRSLQAAIEATRHLAPPAI